MPVRWRSVRDAGRILEAMKDAGVQQIDHLIITHWHGDHFGGLADFASKTTIKEFIDHGPNVQPGELADNFFEEYLSGALRFKAEAYEVAKPGDKILMTGLDVAGGVASAGETIKTPLPGAGKANPYCANYKPGQNNAEDPQSVGIHVAFGKFRTVHLGDLTKNKEFELMCPNNRIGTVDVLLGLHHGQASSNSEVAVYAMHPRVAIMNDGTRKGGEPEVMKTVHSSPGLEDLWQLHFSLLSGQEYSVCRGDVYRQYRLDDPAWRAIADCSDCGSAAGAGCKPPASRRYTECRTAYWIKGVGRRAGLGPLHGYERAERV